MTSTWLIVSVLLVLLLGWALVAKWGQARGITGPMVFLAAGIAMTGIGDVSLPAEQSRQLAELTLVIVLFHDASTVRLSSLRTDPWIAVRLLAIGFPLMLGLTTLAAWWLLPAIGIAGAVLIAASVTPTDAGLGAATILDPVVPVRVRRALNVESGLNDGLATPVALFAIAFLAEEQPEETQLPAVLDIGAIPVFGGLAIGIIIGLVGAWLIDQSTDRGLSSTTTRSLAVVTLPLLALGLALLTDTNGFLAAFAAGIAFGRASRCMEVEETAQETIEVLAELLGFVMWVVAGALLVDALRDGFRWQWLVLAVAALTILRAASVATSLIGTHFRLPTVAFLSWFGPRGLASIVFALLAIEELGTDAAVVQDVTGVVALTVLLSVVLHGATSGPLAGVYGRWATRTDAPIEHQASVEPMPSRGRGMPVM